METRQRRQNLVNAGVTGHQNIGELASWLENVLDQLIVEHTVSNGFSSLALGADQIFAQCILNKGISLTAVIPCKSYDTTFRDGPALKQYSSLLRQASKIEILDYGFPTEDAFYEA